MCMYVVRIIRNVHEQVMEAENSIAVTITSSKKYSLKNEKELGMASHTPPLKRVKKQGEMPLPSLGPLPLKKCRI